MVGPKLQDLVKAIDPNYTMDTAAEEQVLQLADDFLETVTKQSLLLAQHRGSKVLDVQDIQLVLAKHWGISVPGLGLPTLRPLKAGRANLTVGNNAPGGSGTNAAGSGGGTGGSGGGAGGSGGGSKSSSKRKSSGSSTSATAKKMAASTTTAETGGGPAAGAVRPSVETATASTFP